ncbi:PAS domain S-box protein [Brevundimonas lenta]|uniref:histidine kinase n=1 Tax=Brevundimonas lenta TaxID=424796 RepID=A0A7W6JGZ8_9CAUL|nr:PAS domain S-box protein [Brevundimonas lenta]MBB4083998.1 PAS domain S-box-containing protein [Brevundimonas lenta]
MGVHSVLGRILDIDAGVTRLARVRQRSWWVSALIGLGCAVAMLLVRKVLSAFYGDLTGFMILLPAVIVAALAAGRVAGVTALFACLFGGWLVVGHDTLGVGIGTPLGRVATVNFVVVGLFTAMVAAALRKTLGRLDASIDALGHTTARVSDTESRLHVISEQAPVMLWMSDEHGRCVHLNQELRQFWGVTGTEKGFDFAAYLHPDDLERAATVTIDANKRTAPFQIDARFRRADGAWRVLHTEARPRFGPGGEYRGMIGVNTDVTEARAADAALREREAQLQAMVDQASAGIARVGLDGSILSANARFAEILGVRPDDVIGRTTAMVSHPDDVEPTRAALQEALSQGGAQLEKRYVRPDGSTVWTVLSLRALIGAGGTVEGYIAVVVDISGAKAAEAALRESETRFRLMADTAPSPVWLTNSDGEVEFVNEALVQFYGQSADEILGHAWRQAVHPDDLALVSEAQQVARPRHLPYGFEARFRRVDGAWRWMRIAVNPRFDPEGGFMGYVGMSFDVTDTREAMDAVARQERRQSFLLRLTDSLRDIGSPEEIMEEVERALGAELGADRVGYGEVDQERGQVEMSRDWTAGVVSAQGQFSLEDLGAKLIDDLAAGRTIRIPDVREDPRTRDALDVFDRLQTRALMRTPLIRGGRLRAFLYVHASGVRDWTDAEAELLQEVAGRTWTEIERTRAEAEVRESEERFRAIADTAPVLIWVTQQDRTRAFVNQAYVAYNGGSYEEARLADWRDVIHPDDHERIIEDSLAGEATAQPFSMEARYKRHDGEFRWLKSFSRPRFGADGEVIGFVGVAFDVTDIRESQARLMESETRFRTVADSAPVQIWMTDIDGDVAFANRRYKSFFGIGDGDLKTGWRTTVTSFHLEESHEDFVRAVEQRDRYERVMQLDHPTLGPRWLRCEGIPRFDGAGQFQGYVGANVDVTEAKKAEEDLKRINELLEERVGDALAEKAKAEADLMHAQRMEAVGRLTGGVAHDFNNLLTVVIGALDMMLRSPGDMARQRKLGEAALAAARRGEGLTHQLLAFSRRQALRPEPTDLNSLIRESEPLLRRAVGEAVEFKLKLRRGGARVSVDPAQFEAALLNLVVNARDAVGDHGLISIQTAACTVRTGEVPELAAGDYVCVSVTDDGAGMAPEVVGRVFEPFFTTKAIGKGTGLGLSQVYGFARQSGGGVRVASTQGKGTEIRLYLPPIDRSVDLAIDPARMKLDASVAGRRLLLVEDDPWVAAVALELLESMGMEVSLVDTARQALEVLAIEAFDVMLSDVVMPGGMTGIELARESARQWPDMRIVLTSGYAGEDVDEALSKAPWPFLRKPYSREQLAEALGETPADAGD